jgi:hypothetical protein
MTKNLTKINPEISTYIDDTGRVFHYSLINNKTDKLVIHFTAFFGDWGDRKEYKKYYKGYFHRYRMFADQKGYNFLFVCDQYGATQEIINTVVASLNIKWQNIITIGSSMGATGALKFGLKIMRRLPLRFPLI